MTCTDVTKTVPRNWEGYRNRPMSLPGIQAIFVQNRFGSFWVIEPKTDRQTNKTDLPLCVCYNNIENLGHDVNYMSGIKTKRPQRE